MEVIDFTIKVYFSISFKHTVILRTKYNSGLKPVNAQRPS